MVLAGPFAIELWTKSAVHVGHMLILAGKVQTVVLVVQACKTSRKAVERSVQLLKNASAPTGGLVLNMLPNRVLNGYYYSYYQGYGYGNYGKKEADKTSDDTR